MLSFCMVLSAVFAPGFLFPVAVDSFQTIPRNETQNVRAALRGSKRDIPGFVSDLVEILHHIEHESPALYRDLLARPRNELLTALLQAAQTGVSPARKTPNSSPVKKAYLSCKSLEDGRILYYRTLFPRKTDAEQFAKELSEYGKKQKRPFAVILDLRAAQGGEAVSAAPFLSALKSFTGPVAVLTSSKTEGPAELLAALLVRDRNALSLGETTHGSPFPYTVVESAGTVWRIPVIAPEWAGIPPSAHIPAIPSETGRMVKYEEMNSERAIAADSTLRKALDLALSRLVLSPNMTNP